MQEEVENRTLTLGINTTKFTGCSQQIPGSPQGEKAASQP